MSGRIQGRSRARRHALSAIATIAIGCLASGSAYAAPGGANKGNSPGAKQCQKGGWQTLVRSDNTTFAGESDCVAYAAGGGTLVLNTPLQDCKRQLADAGLSEPAGATYVLGTAGDDDLSAELTDGNDVVCGFAGNDSVQSFAVLRGGDVFLGGDGNDDVRALDGGTFVGGAGSDSGGDLSGTVIGGPDDDAFYILYWGTLDGGDGNDSVFETYGGIVNGGAGNDHVGTLLGTFNGGDGDDTVDFLGGFFNGGAGTDSVVSKGEGATCTDVEVGC